MNFEQPQFNQSDDKEKGQDDLHPKIDERPKESLSEKLNWKIMTWLTAPERKKREKEHLQKIEEIKPLARQLLAGLYNEEEFIGLVKDYDGYEKIKGRFEKLSKELDDCINEEEKRIIRIRWLYREWRLSNGESIVAGINIGSRGVKHKSENPYIKLLPQSDKTNIWDRFYDEIERVRGERKSDHGWSDEGKRMFKGDEIEMKLSDDGEVWEKTT
ncbi:MAG: hypothetical protein WC827_00575 [Candidatus Paceibacterota bacterium]|jgi:hypothetical protein